MCQLMVVYPIRNGTIKNIFYVSRTILVDERFFTVHAKIVALEAKWHPSSHTDSHLVVLTSDNMLRFV